MIKKKSKNCVKISMEQEMRVKVLDSKVLEVEQGPTGIHSPLVTICASLRKKKLFSFNLCVLFFFQMVTKLSGTKQNS